MKKLILTNLDSSSFSPTNLFILSSADNEFVIDHLRTLSLYPQERGTILLERKATLAEIEE